MVSAEYNAQLQEKIRQIENLFADCMLPPITVFESPEQHWRMRAEFRIWRDGDELSYAMFAPGEKAGAHNIIKMQTFAAAHQHISHLMPVLLHALQTNIVLQQRLYQVEFLTTLNGNTLVSLIYHRKLDEEWLQAAHQLSQQLNISVIGRSRGHKWVVGQDFVTETLQVHDCVYTYRQPEGAFSQPNAVVCEKMLSWATDAAQGLGGDLLELYCGNGNFTLPLSHCFNRVLATEVSKTSVQAAQINIAANHISNIAIARLSAEEFTQAYQGVREFRRLQEQNIVLADYRFSTVFVDPPRDRCTNIGFIEHV